MMSIYSVHAHIHIDWYMYTVTYSFICDRVCENQPYYVGQNVFSCTSTALLTFAVTKDTPTFIWAILNTNIPKMAISLVGI